jgi:hypothetical protein
MVPRSLRNRPQWLVWRFEKDSRAGKKPRKVPYYATGGWRLEDRRQGEQGSPADRARLVTYDEAIGHALAPDKGGVGFAFLPGDGLAGIDLDRVIDLDTGEIKPGAVRMIKAFDSYTEKSPSGRGLHIFVSTEETGAFKSFKRNELGVEVFCSSQFFTFTGEHWPDTPEDIGPLSQENLERLLKTVKGEPPAGKATAGRRTDSGDDFERVNDAAMRNLQAWVPELLPGARRYQQGYRVSSRDLGRDLEEDLSILPTGIVDWGVNDMGDAREGRRTPVDLVMEWSSAEKPAEALRWLAERLDVRVSDPRAPRNGSGNASGRPPGGDSGPGEPDDGRPVIRWVAGKLPQIVNQAEDALLKSDVRIFRRGGFLVRVIKRDVPSVRNYKRPSSVLGLVTVDQPFLTEALTRAARWVKYNAKKDGWVDCNAPEQVAITYIARVGQWQLPKLWSAISTPTLRPDGTVLQTPGYDKDTQSWYDPGDVEFPEIPNTPDLEQARAALEVFSRPFASFPFESGSDHSVSLALALTALVRRSLPAAPLGAITAPVMASGKTLLADAIAILATGASAPAMKYADKEEEFIKTMLAVLAEGDQVVLIDNVERPLEGETLCLAITSEAYRQRVLGKTEMMSAPTTSLFLATGNHLVVAGDLRTRTLLCRIDPKTEHPERRQFDVELRTWMLEHRAELVAAGLTIMRAFIATGQRPQDFCDTWGRFEHWSDMVRAPLIWLGCADPCASLKSLERDDPERIEHGTVLSAWEAIFRNEPRTAADAIKAANGPDANEQALREALLLIAKDRADGGLDPRRLGNWLRRHADRLIDGRRFVRAGEKDHATLWKVEAMR